MIDSVFLKENITLSKVILKTVPSSIQDSIEIKNDIIINSNSNNIVTLLNFLKNHRLLQFKTLISVTGVDYLDQQKRFEVNYFLLSYKLNKRLTIKVRTASNSSIPSIVSIFESAGWYEREVWDTFGVFFSGHPDLRRILTDYGFEGFPFRKDFPQTGFLEVRYDDEKKHVIYEPLELSQDYRYFDLLSPWMNIK